MKKVILMRHAKSSWEHILQKDKDRTLNERGKNDVPKMAEKFLQQNIKVDNILCSTAQRTIETIQLFTQNSALQKKPIQWLDVLYHASTETINEQIFAQPNDIESVFIVCHNPGITYWVNAQCGIFTNNMPTASYAIFEAPISQWEMWAMAEKKLICFDYPKNSHL